MKLKVYGLLPVLALVLVVGLILILAGCGCFQQQTRGEQPPSKASETKIMASENKTTMPVTKDTVEAKSAFVVELEDINFDFDKYNIREKDAVILRADAAWFKANTRKAVRIGGNCDERGTIEYNLALGQRRADSTKNFLIKLGVDGKLMQTISYGKEKPICQEHNEECWAKNRRAHFVPLQLFATSDVKGGKEL